MEVAQLKEALLNKRPVVVSVPGLEDLEYLCVSAIIYRSPAPDKVQVSAEVQDRCTRSVTIVNPKHIRYKGESEVAEESETKE